TTVFLARCCLLHVERFYCPPCCWSSSATQLPLVSRMISTTATTTAGCATTRLAPPRSPLLPTIISAAGLTAFKALRHRTRVLARDEHLVIAPMFMMIFTRQSIWFHGTTR